MGRVEVSVKVLKTIIVNIAQNPNRKIRQLKTAAARNNGRKN